MKSKILELFGLAAKDKSPEEIAKMAQDAASVIDEETTASVPPQKKEPPAEKDPKAEGKDCGFFESIDDEALDGLLEKLMARKAAKEAAAKQDEDPIEKTIKALIGEKAEKDPEEAHVVPAEEMDGCGSSMDRALAAGILKAMRPAVAGIKDEKQRAAVSDALIKCVSAKDGASDIAKIMQAANDNAKNKVRETADECENLQAMYDARNPHRKAKKEDK